MKQCFVQNENENVCGLVTNSIIVQTYVSRRSKKQLNSQDSSPIQRGVTPSVSSALSRFATIKQQCFTK